MNEINRLQLKKLIKYILLEASLGSNLEISGNIIKCANCGAPADRNSARCKYCGIAHNWKLFDEEKEHNKQVELAKARGGAGSTGASMASLGASAAVTASGFSGGSGKVAPPFPPAATGANQASKPTNVKIKKFGVLLKVRFSNENTDKFNGAANALAFVFKDKYGSLYDQIINNKYETSQENQIVEQIFSFRDSYILKVLNSISSNPTNFDRFKGIDAIVRAVQQNYFFSSDFYKNHVLRGPNAEIVKEFFPSEKNQKVNEGKLYALAGLLSNRDKYLNGLNSLDYDSMEMTTFAENVTRRVTKKLLSGIK